MSALRSQTFRFLAIATLAGAALIGPGRALAHTPEQEQACTGDALRLCGADVPNVDRITACMIRNKEQLSPACRVFFGNEAEHATQIPGKPMNIKPVRAERR